MASRKFCGALPGAPFVLVGALLGGLAGCDSDDEPGDPTPTVPALRGPQQDAYVGTVHLGASLRPQFRWLASMAEGFEGELVYELEWSTDATFQAGVTRQLTEELTYTPSEPLAVSQVAPVGTRYYWRVRACALQLCSERSPVRWVNVGRSPRDFNGDGYADVLVGAPGEGVGGRAHLFFGGAGATFAPTEQLTLALEAPAEMDEFGIVTAFAGDLNGDGFADVVVGAPGVAVPSSRGEGRAHVYLGRAAADDEPAPDAVLDGGPEAKGFGRAVAAAGDVNGDGFSDLIVGAPSGAARSFAQLYLGGATFSTTPAQLLEEPLYRYRFGSAVSSAGDVNGDGYADLLVGQGLTSEGKAYLYLGRAGGEGVALDEVRRLTAPVSAAGFGATVAPGGDLDGDGLADLVVASPRVAYVYFGAAGRLFDAVLDGQLQSPGSSQQISSVASVGDLDGDGRAELIVGNPTGSMTSEGRGAASLYYGGAGARFDAVAEQELGGLEPGDEFGASAVGAGDVNGDGFADVIVGAPRASTPTRADGTATLYFSQAGGALRVAGTLLGADEFSHFGYSVGSGPL